MVDIVVANGAYLNRGEPPDRLETVSSPYGAVTEIEYRPHTDFETPPLTNPTVDGQRRLDTPRWVVSRITIDPGAAFGQPPMTSDYAYFDPVYGIQHRAFRGFQSAIVLGPIADGIRAVTETEFHVSDALRGQRKRIVVSSAPASDPSSLTTLYIGEMDYAHGSGADASGIVTFSDGTIASLPAIDASTQASAFDPFTALMSGSPEAAQAFLAFELGHTQRAVEGGSSSADSRIERSFDVYGNVIRERSLGDVTTVSDNVTTTITYSIRDGSVGSQTVLLANRPRVVTVTGVQGSLPAGTVLQRRIRFYYDGSSSLGAVVRGNPTRVERRWKGGTTWVRVEQSFDAYGNVVEVSSPFDIAEPTILSKVTTSYDSASKTFPTAVVVSSPQDPMLTLEATLGYELTGCGAPKGLGLVCKMTDPNGAEYTHTYDSLGRERTANGPNGAAIAFEYHDSDRATSAQRTEYSARWQAGAGPPASDPNAIREEVYYDGLGRTIAMTRPGRSGQTAAMTASWDAAGNIAETTRWALGANPGPATSFQHDALGRTVQKRLADGTEIAIAYEPRMVTIQTSEPSQGVVHRRVEHLDGHDRLAGVEEYEDPSGTPATTTFLYDAFDQPVVVRNPVANAPGLCGGNPACPSQTHATEIRYDELGNRVQLADPSAGTITREHDARGLVRVEEDGRGLQQVFEYDELGRLVLRHAVNPDAPEADEIYVYGTMGSGPPHGLGRLIGVYDGEGYEEFGYDAAGNVSSHVRVIGGRSFAFEHTYDPLGRRVQTQYPDGETVTWTFEKRLLARIAGSNGAYGGDYVSDVTWDALERPLGVKLGGSASAPVTTQTWSYDSTSGRLDRILAVAGGQTVADLDYTIDGLGRARALVSATMPVGGSALEVRGFEFGHDGLDRLTEARGNFDPASPGANLTLSYGYDALGNLLQKDVGSGSGWTLAYHDPMRPHAVTGGMQEGGGATLGFSYDATGRVTSKVKVGVGGSTTSYEYDSLGRAVQITRGATTGAVGYDVSGRRIRWSTGSATLFYPAPDYEYHVQLGRVNKHFFVDGRRVASSARSWTAPSASTPSIFSRRAPQIPPPPGWLLGLVYGGGLILLLAVALRPRRDALASRSLRVATVVVLALAGPVLVAPRCGRGGGTGATHLGTHGLMALFYVTDHLGSTVLTINAGGGVRNRYLYRPFGDTLHAEGAEIHHQYAGEELLADAGVYGIGPRFYDAEVGRFMQPDPLVAEPAFPQAFNRYSYVLNTPLNLIDPSGLSPEGPGGSGPQILIEVNPLWLLDRLSRGGGGSSGAAAAEPAPLPAMPSAATHIPGPATALEGGSTWITRETVVTVVLDVTGGTSVVEAARTVVSEEATGWDRVQALAIILIEVNPYGKAIRATKVATTGVRAVAKHRAAKRAESAARSGRPTSKIDRAQFRKDREAYWRNEATTNRGKYSQDDLARMRQGRAPIGPDGKPMELHHRDGTPRGPLDPMSRSDHRGGENYMKNHPWLGD
jgi:RHS repeat-associated protein